MGYHAKLNDLACLASEQPIFFKHYISVLCVLVGAHLGFAFLVAGSCQYQGCPLLVNNCSTNITLIRLCLHTNGCNC